MDPEVAHGLTTNFRDFEIGARADLARPLDVAARIITSTPFSSWNKPNVEDGNGLCDRVALPGLIIGDGWELKSNIEIVGQVGKLALGLSERKMPAPLVAEQSFGAQVTLKDGHIIAFEPEEARDLVVKAAARVKGGPNECAQLAKQLLDSLLADGQNLDWYRVGGRDRSWKEDSFVARVGDMVVALMKPEGPHILGMNKTWATVYFDKYVNFADPLAPLFFRSQTEVSSGNEFEALRLNIASETPKDRFMPRQDYQSFHPAFNTSRRIPIGKVLEQYLENAPSTRVAAQLG